MVQLPDTRRLPDWPARLGALAAQRLAQPFAWGPNDCAAWVADAVATMHGHDTLAELRGARRSWRQARRQLQRIGGYPAAMARAGLQPVAPALAGRGDVVLMEDTGDGAQGWPGVLAVCIGDEALAPGTAGLDAMPMTRALMAWRA